MICDIKLPGRPPICQSIQQWLTLGPYNFVNNGWFLTKPVPIESPGWGLLIGTSFVKKQPLLTKFQGPKVNHGGSTWCFQTTRSTPLFVILSECMVESKTRTFALVSVIFTFPVDPVFSCYACFVSFPSSESLPSDLRSRDAKNITQTGANLLPLWRS